MKCPFYGCVIVTPPVLPLQAHLIQFDGNRCALITSAHSPCWMEVAELRAPEWTACPRNPEWITETFRSAAELARWNALANYLDELRTQRAIAAARAEMRRPGE